MKADVQYNDFNGTVAADISDHYDLSRLLAEKGVDSERYEPIGTKFFPDYRGDLAVSVICVDKVKTDQGEPYITEIALGEPMTYAEYFGLFKRFEAIVVTDYYQQYEIKKYARVDELGED